MTEQKVGLELLDAMTKDMQHAPSEFQPTGPTADIVNNLVRELRDRPVQESLQKGSRLLNTIGAINYPPRQQLEYSLGVLREKKEISDDQRKILSAAYDIIFDDAARGILPYELSINALNEAAYRTAEQFGQLCGAKPLSMLTLPQAADSMYKFEFEGRSYSFLFLYYYMRYAYCCRFVDFSKLESYVEIGAGSGRQVEIIKRFHPHINFYLVDLPPQLYVCRKLLATSFERDLVPYETTRGDGFANLENEGKIATLLPHQLRSLRPNGPTLSWNCMVYCIMPKDVVRGYLQLISAFADYVYLIEPMPNTSDAKYGVGDPVQFEDYLRYLTPVFANIDRSKAFRPIGQMKGGWGEACDTFWKKTSQ